MKKSFLPEMTEEKLSPASSHNLAFDRRSHSGIYSHHLKCYLLFPLGIEGSKVIAKYCFFHELSKRTHTTFFFKKYHLLEFLKNFYHSQGCSHDLRNKSSSPKDMYIEGEISFITQTLV